MKKVINLEIKLGQQSWVVTTVTHFSNQEEAIEEVNRVLGGSQKDQPSFAAGFKEAR
jgi:hypothetical protein